MFVSFKGGGVRILSGLFEKCLFSSWINLNPFSLQNYLLIQINRIMYILFDIGNLEVIGNGRLLLMESRCLRCVGRDICGKFLDLN